MQAAPVFVQYLCLNEVELQLCDATHAQVSYKYSCNKYFVCVVAYSPFRDDASIILEKKEASGIRHYTG